MQYWGSDEDAEAQPVSPARDAERSEYPFNSEHTPGDIRDRPQADSLLKERSLAPIGIFASGVGGLTILSALRRELAEEDYIYLGDTAHYPYGTHGESEIIEFATQACRFLIAQGAKLIVVASNTVSQAALNTLRATFSLPFVGVISTVKPATRFTKCGRIGVIAANQAIRAIYLRQLIDDYASDLQVYAVSSPELVALAEQGKFDGPEVEEILRHSLQPLLTHNIDVLILGCTYFPALRTAIERVVGPRVLVLDSSGAVARLTHSILDTEGTVHPKNYGQETGQLQVWCSGNISAFSQVASKLLGYTVIVQQAMF